MAEASGRGKQETALGRNYYWQIMTPGGLLGVIVGFATQRHVPKPAV